MQSDTKKNLVFASFAMSIILCACPSLFMFSTGIAILWGDMLDGAEINFDFPDWTGAVFLILSLVFSLIPVILGLLAFLPELKALAKIGPLRVQSSPEDSLNNKNNQTK